MGGHHGTNVPTFLMVSSVGRLTEFRADLNTIWAQCTTLTFIVHLEPSPEPVDVETLVCESTFEQHVDLISVMLSHKP